MKCGRVPAEGPACPRGVRVRGDPRPRRLPRRETEPRGTPPGRPATGCPGVPSARRAGRGARLVGPGHELRGGLGRRAEWTRRAGSLPGRNDRFPAHKLELHGARQVPRSLVRTGEIEHDAHQWATGTAGSGGLELPSFGEGAIFRAPTAPLSVLAWLPSDGVGRIPKRCVLGAVEGEAPSTPCRRRNRS